MGINTEANRQKIENLILTKLYEAWVKDSDGSIDANLLGLKVEDESTASLVVDDLIEAELIRQESFGGIFSLTSSGVLETERRKLAAKEILSENSTVRSALVQRASEVREQQGRDAEVNIGEVISDFNISEDVAFRNARLLDDLGWIDFRTNRLYAITPFGRDRYRQQLETSQAKPKKSEQIFETVSDSYTIVGTLGQGGVGVVYEVRNSSSELLALKIISESIVSTEKIKRFHNELQFLSRNNHPNLVSIVDEGFVIRDGTKIPFYVMPKYASTLRRLMSKGIAVSKVLRYFDDILGGLEFLHSKGIFHRDLKPENILYNAEADCVLLADLGAAHFAEDELFTLVETKAGTRLANFQYAAPEQRERGKTINHQSDLYAVGLLLNEMFTRSIPAGEEYPKISEFDPNFAALDQVVAKLIKHRPENRYQSVSELRTELGGLFANGRDSTEIDSGARPLGIETVNLPNQGEAPKSSFQKALEEIDRLKGEQTFNQQKLSFFRSQEGSDASFKAFANLLTIAEERVAMLNSKDLSFVLEKTRNDRVLMIKSSGFSLSFAIEVKHVSNGTEYLLFAKRWKGMLSSNPNAVYFDPDLKPAILEEKIYKADLDSSYRLFWLGPKETNHHSSQDIVEGALEWLVNQVVARRRASRY